MRLLFILFICWFPLQALSNVKVVWLDGLPTEAQVKQELLDSEELAIAVTLINDLWPLEETINVIIGGSEEPFYDPELGSIFISYAFALEVQTRFNRATAHRKHKSVREMNSGVVHTLFHEYAHALIDKLQLPVLGREEDAADSFASFALLEVMPNGQQILQDSADLFYLEGLDPEPFSADLLADSHSLSIQRYYAALCHIYVKDKVANSLVLDQLETDDEWQNTCVADYDMLVDSWKVLLAE